ncbi:MAG TPA: GNAT family N-acetyltransferase [Chloroflexia bacterium]|nr:GNAT family N-acetyltransferase [Chloroflexia bacterium]
MDAPWTPYTPEHVPALIDIWNAVLDGAIPLGPELWRQQIDEDPLFTPDDCLIAAGADGRIAGFAITRQLPESQIQAYPGLDDARGRGYIMALAVHPRARSQGYGRRLLEAAEARLRAQGARRIVLWGPPGLLVPAVPRAGGSAGFWARHGYTDPQVVADLRGDLHGWQAPPPPAAVTSGAYAFRQGHAGEETAILAWMDAAFPGSWPYGLRRAFSRGYRPADVTLLVDDSDAIRGFCCAFHAASGWLGGGSLYFPPTGGQDWGGLGPLGVETAVRGLGLGLAIVAAGVVYLQGQGVRRCGIDWITLRDFYAKLGFGIWQEYDGMVKHLLPSED